MPPWSSTGGPGGLRLGAGPASWSLYRNGWNSWSNARAFTMDESDAEPWLFAIADTTFDPGTPRSGEPGRFRSELVAALADRTGPGGLVLGFVGGARCLSVIDVAADVPGGTWPADAPGRAGWSSCRRPVASTGSPSSRGRRWPPRTSWSPTGPTR